VILTNVQSNFAKARIAAGNPIYRVSIYFTEPKCPLKSAPPVQSLDLHLTQGSLGAHNSACPLYPPWQKPGSRSLSPFLQNSQTTQHATSVTTYRTASAAVYGARPSSDNLTLFTSINENH